MSQCMDCAHWNPKATDPGMARLGFARCDKRPTPGLSMSGHAAACAKFNPAAEATAKARHAKWDVKSEKKS
jgi:hypothetical protein